MAAEDSYFHWYCREGKLSKVVEVLSGRECQAGAEGVGELLEKRDGLYSYTPLHEAASYGQDQVLRVSCENCFLAGSSGDLSLGHIFSFLLASTLFLLFGQSVTSRSVTWMRVILQAAISALR